jgi:cation transport ATPase
MATYGKMIQNLIWATGYNVVATLTRSPFRLTRTPHSAATLMMVAALKGRPPNHRLQLRSRPEVRQ